MSNDMLNETASRRTVIKKLGVGAAALTGGAAATTGTAAAQTTSGDVTVYSESNDWDYTVGIDKTYFPDIDVEKGSKADAADKIQVGGASAVGNVNEGGTDTYKFPAQIARIFAEPDGSDAFLRIEITSVVGRGGGLKGVRLAADRGGFDYSFTVSENVIKGNNSEGNDTVNGDSASGYVGAGYIDNYTIGGYFEEVTVSDPESGGSDGLVVEFDP